MSTTNAAFLQDLGADLKLTWRVAMIRDVVCHHIIGSPLSP